MIDPPLDVARRLKRDARQNRLVERHWGDWKLILTFGPHLDAFSAERTAAPLDRLRQLYGRDVQIDPERARELERDLWHLSASWRAARTPTEAELLLLEHLLNALGVPPDKREGYHAFDQRVKHWSWKDEESSGA